MSTPTGATTTVWTPEAIRQLGMTTDVATAGAILGIGRSNGIRTGQERRVSGRHPADRASLPRPDERHTRAVRGVGPLGHDSPDDTRIDYLM